MWPISMARLVASLLVCWKFAAADPSAKIPPYKMVITNAVWVPDSWVINELTLLMGHCHQKIGIPAWGGSYFSSGQRREFPEATHDKAFDFRLDTNWTADCKLGMGGCNAYEHFIGLDITGMDQWERAMGPNVSRKDWENLRVKCIRLFQDEDPRYKADAIALQEVRPYAGKYRHWTYMKFDNIAGGVWSRRPANKNTLWRIRNLGPTDGQWSVSELRMYKDVFCNKEVPGKAISSGSMKAMDFPEANLLDDDVKTDWRATCIKERVTPGCAEPGEAVPASCKYIGCDLQEAWIGLDFSDVEVKILCFRMFQPARDPLAVVVDRHRYSEGFGLERWLGHKWEETERYWSSNTSFMVPSSLQPTVQAPFIGAGPGRWENARPPNHGAWRIMNDIFVPDVWLVQEIEFYEDSQCGGKPATEHGTAVSMAGPEGIEKAGKAFDGDASFVSVWESTCLQGVCFGNEAWVGQYFRDYQPAVTCFKITQSQHTAHMASSVALSMWWEGKWKLHSTHRDIGGGTWNRRPADPWSMWRVLNNEPVPGQWRVHEIRAYKDPNCLDELTGSNGIGSGYKYYKDNALNAFDGTVTSAWGADCNPCNITRGYWLGGELKNATQHGGARQKRMLVQCIQIWQSPDWREQATALRVDIWKGLDWTVSDIAIAGNILTPGGGTWTRTEALYMTKWRLMPMSGNDQRWKIREFELYSDTNCTVKLRRPKFGGTQQVMSGYGPQLSGFDMSKLTEDYFSEGDLAFDNNNETGVVVMHEPSMAWPGWFGIDFRTETTWVRCMRMQQGGLAPEQVTDLALEFWDGKNWTRDDADFPLKLNMRQYWFRDLGGAGWQRRPALPDTLWKMENLDYVPEGWAVNEVEFHGSTSCNVSGMTGAARRGLQGEPIASGFVPLEFQHGAQNAFDGDLKTPWVSQCAEIFPESLAATYRRNGITLDPVGCHKRAAWIGLDFRLQPQNVRCIRINQVGYGNQQTGSIVMSRWDGMTWKEAWTASGLGGTTWDQRPVAPNSMWRIYHLEARPTKCPKEARRLFPRLWGVSELTFYSNDDCTDKIENGVPIGSGTIERYRKTVYDASNYSIENAFDGDEDSEWGANCLSGWRGEANASRTSCPGSWLGLDFRGRNIEVRCIKVMQSRRESSTGFDPASKMRLDRWNGSEWVEASWKHVPKKGNPEGPRYLGAVFVKMGPCAADSYEGLPADVRLYEERTRRASESCIVPLTGAVVLLGDAACVEHRGCQAAFGVGGDCCPVSGVETRCCCSFLGQENIFEDEQKDIGIRKVLRLELCMIILANTVPIAGGALALFLYILGLCLPANAQERMQRWASRQKGDEDDDEAGLVDDDDDEESCCGRCYGRIKRCCGRVKRCMCCVLYFMVCGPCFSRCCCGPRCKRLVLLICWPFLLWRTFLREDEEFNWIGRWFVRPGDRWPRGAQWIRLPLFVAIGAYVGGIAPWAAAGALMGQTALYCLFLVGLAIRWSKSPFDPECEWDMQLRDEIAEQPLKSEQHMSEAVDVAREFIGMLILSVVYFLKFVFDLLVCRAQLISFGAIPSIEADRVVDIFPGLTQFLRDPGMVLYKLMYWASQTMGFVIGYFVGIPGCEGSCVLIGSMALVMVLVTLTKFLNYDFFGLFAAARQVAKSTRPACQRALFQGGIMGGLSLTFGTIQCAMVVFSRALKVADPFRSSTWACEWNDIMAIVVGRGLIFVSASVGIVLFGLCANGHFMGQDYIIKPVGRFLRLNLDALDPDGVGDEGGLFQCSVLFAMAPTICGVWLDWWNVRAYLVEERATIYAEQMRDPQTCLHCGEIHVKYNWIMTATGRQVSLACQILPYGILIGKASEYCNDPPLIYWGKKLRCCQVAPTPIEKRPDLGKGKWSLKMLLFAADTFTFLGEFGLPLFRRLCSLALYIFVLLGTFSIDEGNLVVFGRQVIMGAFVLAVLKAAGESFLENLLSWLVSLVYMTVHAVEHQLSQDMDIARTVAGQVASGTTVSSVVVICAPLQGWTTEGTGIIVATCAGIGISLLTLFVNWLLEHPPVEPGMPPHRKSFPTIVKLVFAMGIAALTTFFTMDAILLRSVIACAMMTVGVELLVMKLVLVEESTLLGENLWQGVYRPKEGEISEADNSPARKLSSPTLIVMTTKRMIPGPVGILVGAVLGLLFSKAVAHFSKSSKGAFASLLVGVPTGTIAGLAVNSIMEKPPLVYCLFSGAVTCVFVSLWNGLVGIVTGAIVGVSIGSLFEECKVHEKWQFDGFNRPLKIQAKEDHETWLAEEAERKAWRTLDRDIKQDNAIQMLALANETGDSSKQISAIHNTGEMIMLAVPEKNVVAGVLTNEAGVTEGVPVKALPSSREAHGALTDVTVDNNVPKEEDAPRTADLQLVPVTNAEGQVAEVLRVSAEAEAVPVAPSAEAQPKVPPGREKHPPVPPLALEAPADQADNSTALALRKGSKHGAADEEIVDGFSQAFGNYSQAGSVAGSSREQQYSASRPKPAPEHVKKAQESNMLADMEEADDQDLFGRWDGRTPCDTVKAEDSGGHHPAVAKTYRAPGQASIWQQRIAAPPGKQSLRTAHAKAVRRPTAKPEMGSRTSASPAQSRQRTPQPALNNRSSSQASLGGPPPPRR